MEGVVARVVAGEDFVEPEGEGIRWNAEVRVRGREELHDVGTLAVFFGDACEDVDTSVGAAAHPLDGKCQSMSDWDGSRDVPFVGFITIWRSILFAHGFVGEEGTGDVVDSA
jgi:hypothetical protein